MVWPTSGEAGHTTLPQSGRNETNVNNPARRALKAGTALLVLCLLQTSFSQGAVGVQPNAVILSVPAGSTISQELRIDNPAANLLNLSIYPGDWQYDGRGQIAYFPAGTLERSAAEWLTFSSEELELAGRGNTTITYTVQVPADAEPGTHWAALFVEGTDPRSADGNALTRFKVRTAHTLYVNVPPVELAGEITGIMGSAPESPEAPYTMLLNYFNHGNGVQILNGRVEIRSLAGELIDTIPVERQLALPGMLKTINMQLYGPLQAAEYLALAVLNYGDVTLDVAAELVFEIPKDLVAPEFYFDGARERTGVEGTSP